MSPEVRSRIMRAIKGKDTRPELALRHELFRLGVKFTQNSRDLPGRPDVVVPAVKLAVFVHGCFWHSCPKHGRAPKGRPDWALHLAKNRRRDRRVRAALNAQGWRTMVVWEHEDPACAALRVSLRAEARR